MAMFRVVLPFKPTASKSSNCPPKGHSFARLGVLRAWECQVTLAGCATVDAEAGSCFFLFSIGLVGFLWGTLVDLSYR